MMIGWRVEGRRLSNGILEQECYVRTMRAMPSLLAGGGGGGRVPPESISLKKAYFSTAVSFGSLSRPKSLVGPTA